jgi:hypothetical protein
MPSPLSSALAASLLAVAALAPRPAAAQFGTNLLVNGNAEAGPGSATGNQVLAVPGWTTTGTFTVVQYAAGGGFPGASSAGPADRGAHFFAGGPGSMSASATQRLDLAGIAGLLPQVATGTVHFTLGGFFGGFSGQDDAASLTARFLDGGGALLGSTTAGPVFAAARGGVTGLLERSVGGMLPADARSVEFTLAMSHREGNYNDAYADNLSFVLAAAPATTVPEPGTWALVGTGLAGVLGVARRRAVRGATPGRVS